MMVCTVLIWFILTVLQESSNIDAIFIVCRNPPPFLVKSQLFEFFLTLPLVNKEERFPAKFNVQIFFIPTVLIGWNMSFQMDIPPPPPSPPNL